MADPDPPPELGTYRYFSPCIIGIATVDRSGGHAIGAAFHIGDGYLVTARHVVEDRRIVNVVTHGATISIDSIVPIYPADPSIDLAILRSDFSLDAYMRQRYWGRDDVEKIDHLVLGGHLDDWVDDGLVLLPIVVFGFPPIPLSAEPILVAVRGEINAVVDPYVGSPHPLFIVSPLARGGFSGGPVILDESYVLGVVTVSLTANEQSPELGFFSALTVEPIWNLLFENRIFPGDNARMMYELRGGWGFDVSDFPPGIAGLE